MDFLIDFLNDVTKIFTTRVRVRLDGRGNMNGAIYLYYAKCVGLILSLQDSGLKNRTAIGDFFNEARFVTW